GSGDLEVTLVAELDEPGLRLTAIVDGRQHRLGTADPRVLSTEAAGGFVGTMVGPFAEFSTADHASEAAAVTVLDFDYRPR
ncbi:MAG: hypothetical protein ABI255_10250, partial [Microbacteriaceae bacterium]